MARPKVARSHRQVGLVSAFWLILVAVTAILLNHRDLFASSQPDSDGPYGQYLLAHSISPHDPAQVLVGTATGLYFSVDGGKSFRGVILPVKAEQVVGVAFHPTQHLRMYAALREAGLFASSDGGKYWERVEFPGPTTINSLSISFEGTLTVLTPEGLYTRVEDAWRISPRPEKPGQEVSRQGWMQTAYNLHDGHFWGRAATFVSDCIALSLLWMCGSGLFLAFRKER